jgi:hypothetical protein
MSQWNWINWSTFSDPPIACEYPFYSDAHIFGDNIDNLGPYSFLSNFSLNTGPGVVNSPIILRAMLPPEGSEVNARWVDEIAALASVSLGVRIYAGGYTRVFKPDKNPYGEPWSLDDKPKPVINIQKNRLILPSVVGARSINQLKHLKSIPFIDQKRYVNLVRACKFYQDALWIAESQPIFAWIMLVSALETGAVDFYSVDTDLGVTKKYAKFTIKFMPDEPEKRPEVSWLRVNWSRKKLNKIIYKVYDYRSRFLHEGVSFPFPMCSPPIRESKESIPSEIPCVGLEWKMSDVPINLNCFQYIVRGVLLNWWRSLAEQNNK